MYYRKHKPEKKTTQPGRNVTGKAYLPTEVVRSEDSIERLSSPKRTTTSLCSRAPRCSAVKLLLLLAVKVKMIEPDVFL